MPRLASAAAVALAASGAEAANIKVFSGSNSYGLNATSDPTLGCPGEAVSTTDLPIDGSCVPVMDGDALLLRVRATCTTQHTGAAFVADFFGGADETCEGSIWYQQYVGRSGECMSLRSNGALRLQASFSVEEDSCAPGIVDLTSTTSCMDAEHNFFPPEYVLPALTPQLSDCESKCSDFNPKAGNALASKDCACLVSFEGMEHFQKSCVEDLGGTVCTAGKSTTNDDGVTVEITGSIVQCVPKACDGLKSRQSMAALSQLACVHQHGVEACQVSAFRCDSETKAPKNNDDDSAPGVAVAILAGSVAVLM